MHLFCFLSILAFYLTQPEIAFVSRSNLQEAVNGIKQSAQQ